MGWSSQGYNRISGCWEVEGYTSGLNPEIEKFHKRKLDLKEYTNTRIIFGPSGEIFFRGYIFSNNPKTIKEVLSKFNGFLVYASKYGDKSHSFEYKNLTFYNFKEITLFLEQTIFYDFEWDEFKEHIKSTLDFDNISKATKDKILEMKIPKDYNEEKQRIENQISLIDKKDSSLILEIINSIKREDLQKEIKEKYK